MDVFLCLSDRALGPDLDIFRCGWPDILLFACQTAGCSSQIQSSNNLKHTQLGHGVNSYVAFIWFYIPLSHLITAFLKQLVNQLKTNEFDRPSSAFPQKNRVSCAFSGHQVCGWYFRHGLWKRLSILNHESLANLKIHPQTSLKNVPLFISGSIHSGLLGFLAQQNVQENLGSASYSNFIYVDVHPTCISAENQLSWLILEIVHGFYS